MIKGKARVKGGSVFISELLQTYIKNELLEMDNDSFKMLCGFMTEKELQRTLNLMGESYKAIIIQNIFNRF